MSKEPEQSVRMPGMEAATSSLSSDFQESITASGGRSQDDGGHTAAPADGEDAAGLSAAQWSGIVAFIMALVTMMLPD